MVAIRRNQTVTTWPTHGLTGQTTAERLVVRLAPDAWQRLSCGAGAQGERTYDWAYLPLRPGLVAGWTHALLVRRHPIRPAELSYYLVFARAATPLAAIVRAAGSRWAVEDPFKLAKGQVGLDHYETRSWRGWHRHTILALWALAILAAEAARAKEGTPMPRISSPSVSRNCVA